MWMRREVAGMVQGRPVEITTLAKMQELRLPTGSLDQIGV